MFHLPQTEAAQALGTSVRKVKMLCGLYNIARWPHRALQSLEKLCALVQEESHHTPNAASVRSPRSFREPGVGSGGRIGSQGGLWWEDWEPGLLLSTHADWGIKSCVRRSDCHF